MTYSHGIHLTNKGETVLQKTIVNTDSISWHDKIPSGFFFLGEGGVFGLIFPAYVVLQTQMTKGTSSELHGDMRTGALRAQCDIQNTQA